jgi:hypothetical protein
MSRMLAISDSAYHNLARTAEAQGFENVEAFLENWATDSPLAVRQAAIDRIFKLQAEMASKYGSHPDSTELIRQDRSR